MAVDAVFFLLPTSTANCAVPQDGSNFLLPSCYGCNPVRFVGKFVGKLTAVR